MNLWRFSLQNKVFLALSCDMVARFSYFHILVLAWVIATQAIGDRASADTLAERLEGSVSGVEIHPAWAPDDSALYIHEAEQINRIDLSTGKRSPMINSKAVSEFIESDSFHLERFSISDENEFICLIQAGKAYWVLSINNNDIAYVKPEKDPFALAPVREKQAVRSHRYGGETAIIFFNNTDKPQQIFWADSAGIPQPYAIVEPGKCYRQHTFAGDAWIANGLGFVGRDEPSTAYMNATSNPLKVPEKHPERDEKWPPSFLNNNLFIKNRETGKETQLTSDGTPDWKYCGPAIESPDGRYLIAIREKAGENRHIDLVEAAPKGQLQPRTVSIPYPKPGDRIAQRKPCLFDLKSMKTVPLDDELFPNPWDVYDFHWAPDSKRLFFIYNERGHQTARLLAIQAKTGKVAIVAEETSRTFIDWTNKLNVHHLDKTDEAIWMSQRSGWNHLYLIDRKTGKANPITSGEWVVRNIERVDEEKREILFRACGVYSGMDPYYFQYARVSFDGSNLTWLTQGNGTHTVSFSPEGKYYIDSWSRVDQPPVHELRRYGDGKKIMTLGQADASALLQIHPYLPEPFCAKGRDGETDIYGVIYRPSDFDPERKYPVVESIYAGPQDFFVPKAFKPYRAMQQLAELGFMVVQIDGMGTNWRSKKFHDVCWKNLKDAGFPDRIAWMKAAAEKYPCMDLSRVGIYGTSAGGQSAMRAVIDHADFYKAAAADSGCHDNRMDKIWWNEQWMGWPVDESYIENSNMVDAHKLGGKLLLTVGAMDSNVDPSSTMQVVDELIKADKDFELMVFPSAGHGAGMGTYGTRLREDFFIRNLQ